MKEPRQILFIEDDATTAAMYTKALELHGHRVEVVADGTAGYERLRHRHYDLLLLDLMIPGMKGAEILSRLAATSARDRIKIIILTNMTTSDHDRLKLAKLADVFFLKAEVIPSQLTAKVEELLR